MFLVNCLLAYDSQEKHRLNCFPKKQQNIMGCNIFCFRGQLFFCNFSNKIRLAVETVFCYAMLLASSCNLN